ncbi:hypothetical protein C0993_007737 [Termitomyces sp. T159_Od127]|nr:hypothetical protein C0993_007737 [Termitomyces sp. T159_Od127]
MLDRDTVSSVGLIPERLPLTTSNTSIRTCRHAVALDECCANFKANLWNRPSEKELLLGVKGQKREVSVAATGGKTVPYGEGDLLRSDHRYAGSSVHLTDVEEVQVAGAHCDVGGGSVENGTPHPLARIPLRWMICECFRAKSGIIFVSDGLPRVGLNPTSLYPCVQRRPPSLSAGGSYIQNIPTTIPTAIQQKIQLSPGVDSLIQITKSKEEHELLDALSLIYDLLDLVPIWWSLGFYPMRQHYQKSDNLWDPTMHPNLGRGRLIPQQKTHVIKVHRSVKQRMEAQYPVPSTDLRHLFKLHLSRQMLSGEINYFLSSLNGSTINNFENAIAANGISFAADSVGKE